MRGNHAARAALGVAALLLGSTASCSERDAPGTRPAASPTVAEAEPAGTGRCSDVDPTACLLPWPNDSFTRADPGTPTGRRLDLPADGMPVNKDGVRIGTAEWDRNDGFSPSSVGLVTVPDLDLTASGLPAQTDIARSMRDDSPLVVVDVTSGERVPAWAELDLGVTDPTRRLLRIVPAVGLAEGHRIAIGLRSLMRSDGADVEPTAGVGRLRTSPTSTERSWLDALAAAGLRADQISTAWSFTVASGESLSGRLRHMWNETRAEVGDGAPPFTVTSAEVVGAAKVVRGTFDMPRYLQGDGGPGSVFNNDGDPDGTPTRNGSMRDEFVCTVPSSATAAAPAPFVLYGHGLLGSRDEVLGIGAVGASAGIGFCALDFLGMSRNDLPTVIGEFAELSGFRTQADRLQQGHLGFLLLGRLLASGAGFATGAAFQDATGGSVIDGTQLSFLGASQGGILGGVPSALSQDWSRVILAVGGMGYNLLLRRSIDFDEFATPFQAAYPDELDQALALELVQQLWDRGENTGYARHLTADPYEGVSERRTVMLLEAFGDHQVANVSTEKLARTLGVPRRVPTLADGRSRDADPFFGIPAIESLPHRGSGLVVWDFGTPAPPASQSPPREGDDPHGKLGDEPDALALVASFIARDGAVVDVCEAQPCRSPG